MKDVLTRLSGVVVGVIDGVAADGRPVVRWDEEAASRAAMTAWSEREPDWGTCRGQRVWLAFADGDETRPVVLALLERPRRFADEDTAPESRGEAAVEKPKPRTLRIDSEEELVLECGKARISLRADGRIVILGGYVLSRSTGVNKVKGASVQIN